MRLSQIALAGSNAFAAAGQRDASTIECRFDCIQRFTRGCRAHIKRTVVGSRTQLESWGEEGDTPVCETDDGRECVPEYHGTLGILWESGWTTIQG